MLIGLGIDCGGTRTRMIALDSALHEVFHCESGPANWASTPRDRLENSLVCALANAPHPNAIYAGFAGLLTEDDRRNAVSLLTRLTCAETVQAVPDYAIAWAAAGPQSDVCIISGTGSLICSESADGIVKTGGGGPLFGDDGSAYGVVRMAISLLLSRNRPKECPAFEEAIFKLCGENSLEACISKIYRTPIASGQLASLAGILALDWDEVEGGLGMTSFHAELSKLARLCKIHVDEFHSDLPRVRVGLMGGSWKLSSKSVPYFSDALLQEGVRATVSQVLEEPARAAAKLALSLL